MTLLLIASALLVEQATRRTPFVRRQAVAALNDKFDSKVEIERLQVSGFPRPEVTGGGIVARYHGRTDVPPLLAVSSFSASAGVIG